MSEVIYKTLDDYVRREREDSIRITLPRGCLGSFVKMLHLRGYRKKRIVGRKSEYVKKFQVPVETYAGRGSLNCAYHVKILSEEKVIHISAHVDHETQLKHRGWKGSPFEGKFIELTDRLERELRSMTEACLTGKKLEEVLRR
ncbi:hypothetical protein DRN62_03395 [Nanoarchaeota archaeon]|nr:MAG: hypothetical protein DRN62_03395 [Nanoarchaeota archaeon]